MIRPNVLRRLMFIAVPAVFLFFGGSAASEERALIRKLTDPGAEAGLSEDSPAEAALSLAAGGEQAVEALLEVLGHESPDVRRLAAWALGEAGSPRAAGALAVLLEDDDSFVSTAAAEALGKLGPAAAGPAAVYTQSGSARARKLAARALGAAGAPEAAGRLEGLLSDSDAGVRMEAARALGRLRAAGAVDALVPLLGDSDIRARRHAVWALGEIGEPSAAILVEALSDPEELVREGAVEALVSIGEPAAGYIIGMMETAGGGLLRAGAEVLFKTGYSGRGGLGVLLAALDEPDAVLRGYAAGALGHIGGREAFEALVGSLDDEAQRVRLEAVAALGRTGEERAVAPLAGLLDESDAGLRRAAAESLGMIGLPALEALLACLEDEDSRVRETAAGGLGGTGDSRIVGPLVAALEAERSAQARFAMIEALGRTRDPRVFEPLMKQLEDFAQRRHTYGFNTARGALEQAFGRKGAWGWEEAIRDWRSWWEQEGREEAADMEYRQAMQAGEAYYEGLHAFFWDPIDYASARAVFERAAGLAQTDYEKARAVNAKGRSRLDDFYRETDYGSIRRDFEQVLGLEGAGAAARSEALFGIGETYLRESRYDEARASFAGAGDVYGTPEVLARVEFEKGRSLMQERRYAGARRKFERLLEMPGVRSDRGLGWEARALMKGMRLLPRIRQDRPRMFFNSDNRQEVRRRALSEEKEYFDSIAAAVGNIDVDQITDSNRRMRVMDAALVYLVNEEAEDLEKAKRILRGMMNYYLGRPYFTRDRSSWMIAWLSALDWLWHDLPVAERKELSSDLVRYGYSFYTADRARDQLHRFHLGRAFNYYEKNVIFYTGLGAINEEMDDLEYFRALALLGRGFLHNSEEINWKFDVAKDDGSFRTALEYYFGATFDTLWPFLYCWESSFGLPSPDKMVFLLSPDYVLRNALEFGDGRMRHFGYGRSWRHSGGMPAANLYDHLWQMLIHFGHSEQAGIAGWLRERMEEKGIEGTRGVYSVYPFLAAAADVAPSIPENMPIARHFEQVGQILMSSGFGPGETYALFSCGGNVDEADFDATHFSIFRDGYMALDSGTRAQGTPEGCPSGREYEMQTVAHNCVLIRMPGETMVDPRGNPISSNSGGQRRLPRPAYTDLLAFESGEFFAYAATDATRTYHEDKCGEMVRQFVFIPPYHFVVFDRVTSKNAEYPKKWLLHTSNEPVIQGGEFRADQGGGRIFCRTIHPEDAVLQAVGGPGKEFWADGRNWPIHEDSPYFRTIGMEPGGEVPESIGRWRVEVSPGAAREEDYFLHLIQVGGQTEVEMAGSRLTRGDNSLGVEFSSKGINYELSFNKTGQAGGRIRITEGRRVLFDSPLTKEVMPQSGLALTGNKR